jgi:hypothetical protein
MNDLDLVPWEPLVDESDDQYQAFVAYRDLPRLDRSLRNSTAAELGFTVPWDPGSVSAAARRKHGARLRARERWSSANSWVMRVRAWDDEQARLRLARRADAVDEMIERHADLGRLMQQSALEAIDAVNRANAGELVVTDQRGNPIRPARFLAASDHAIIRAMVEGCRIERAAYGIEGLTAGNAEPVGDDKVAPQRELMLSSPKMVAHATELLREQKRLDREAAKG